MRYLAPCALLFLIPAPSDSSPGNCSPGALVVDQAAECIYIADAGRSEILVLDIAGSSVVRRIALASPPSGLALAQDGRLLVTTAEAEGRVLVLDSRSGEQRRTLAAGHMPSAPLLDPAGETLYLCNRFAGMVSFLDLGSGTIRARVKVPREPVAIALTPDGGTLFAADHLPVGRADGDFLAAGISVIDTRAARRKRTISLPNGSTSVRGLCISPDGRHVFATHILARYHLPASQLERGWMNTNALSILDVERGERIATVLLDDFDLGAANPWGLACSPDGQRLAVAHSGTHELSLIDLPAMMAKIARLDEQARAALADDLSFLGGLRRRIPLAGIGPRELIIAAGRVWVAERFSASLGVVPLEAASSEAASLPLGKGPEESPARRGERLFHDATLSFQRWQSCASCHPDARTDGLNWDLLNDGLGNSKNTKSLLLAHETPPAMALSARGDAEAAVRAGLRHILFSQRPEPEARAIDAYLRSLVPLPSPHRLDPPATERGHALFERAGCADCHPAPLYTDLESYELGMGRTRDAGRKFDTPSLIELWRTAPYLHDGRAADLEAVLREHNAEDRHGSTRKLDEVELAELARFLRTL